MNPDEYLRAGCRILDPVLVPQGFKFRLGEGGKGSGGQYAMGEYSRMERRLEIHFRWSLGLVTYRFGSVSSSHEALMRALRVQGESAYPGFSDDPLDGFRHLRRDLERFGQVFLAGDDAELLDLLSAADRLDSERPEGFSGLP